jgi:K(+)-stimulated pyrophosphate-energized sodium pump
VEDSKKVVEICTIYAQKGMYNIFLTIFFSTLAFAFFDAFFFIGYLISIAIFGLFQALFMANAGGAWDNAKKVVEVELKMKGTPLHDATIVGDTVGDPFKDTSSVALNPVIKFTTLFGLLAVELAQQMKEQNPDSALPRVLAAVFFAISVVFVYRSFYGMRIGGVEGASKTESKRDEEEAPKAKPAKKAESKPESKKEEAKAESKESKKDEPKKEESKKEESKEEAKAEAKGESKKDDSKDEKKKGEAEAEA